MLWKTNKMDMLLWFLSHLEVSTKLIYIEMVTIDEWPAGLEEV